MHFRNPHLKMPVRVVLGATMISMYLSGAVYAVFPHTELGKMGKEVFLVFAGICFMALPICWVLHLSEQVIRSVQHLKRVRHEHGQPFLLGDESVVIFSGWVEGGAAIFLFVIVCGFWIGLLALAAYLVSFGTLGSIQLFQGNAIKTLPVATADRIFSWCGWAGTCPLAYPTAQAVENWRSV